MSLLRFIHFYVFNRSPVNYKELLVAFWLGFRYDARVAGIVLLVILLLGSIPFCNPFQSTRARKAWFSFFNVFAITLIIFYVVDFLHYRYLFQRLNATALNYLEDARISGAMVWQSYPVLRIFVAMIAGVLLLRFFIIRMYKLTVRSNRKSGRSAQLLWFSCCFLMCALAIFGRVGQYPLRWSDAFNQGNEFNANLALNPFQSFFSSLSFRTSGYDKAKVKQYYPLMAAYLGIDNPDSSKLHFERVKYKTNRARTTQPNIVLVICESFSAYKSSMWGNPLNTTPYFYELCKQGVFFDNCFTPHSGTARGVWATITGIPDVELVKTASRNPAMVDQHTIVNDFDGYRKFYFLGGSTSWANIRGLLTNNIQDLQLYEEDSYNLPKIDVWGISDKNLLLEANRILEKQQDPFFAIIQTADNHRPYTIPKEDLKEFTPVNFPQDSIRKYGFESNEELNAFRYTDFSFRKFIEATKRSAYFKNTIFIFTGDHGIGGNAGNMFPRAWTDLALTAYHVPLLFYSPGLLSPRRLHQVASQVDILPTAAGLANISYRNTTLGRDLLQPANDSSMDNVAFIIDHNNRDVGIIKGNYFYSRRSGGKNEDLVWTNFYQKEKIAPNDSMKQVYRHLTTAYLESAKYMLWNNKKLRQE